ncbi:conjugative transposon protein TraM, partial [Escherichia coli]|nr:conjugative transposon protein TraM [Escherichia coli]
LLAAPLPDSVFAREFVKPRNWGFNTVGSDLREPERNSIRAALQQTVTLTDGGEVTFRLLEPVKLLPHQPLATAPAPLQWS